MDVLIGILIVIVILIFVVGILVMNVIRAVRAFRSAANSKAVQIAAEMAQEILSGDAGDISIDLLSSQKPRSISDMTSVYAPSIARDFPDLNLKQLISSAGDKLCAALYAIMEGTSDGSGLPSSAAGFSGDESLSGESGHDGYLYLGATSAFAAQIQRQIEALTAEDKNEYFERVRIHKTGIKSYTKNAGTCSITLQTAIEYLHYITQNGVVVSGSRQTVEQARYDISLIYVHDESMLASSQTTAVSVTCPNCGAPARGLGLRACEYCGSALETIDIRIWRINQFTLS